MFELNTHTPTHVLKLQVIFNRLTIALRKISSIHSLTILSYVGVTIATTAFDSGWGRGFTVPIWMVLCTPGNHHNHSVLVHLISVNISLKLILRLRNICFKPNCHWTKTLIFPCGQRQLLVLISKPSQTCHGPIQQSGASENCFDPDCSDTVRRIDSSGSWASPEPQKLCPGRLGVKTSQLKLTASSKSECD